MKIIFKKGNLIKMFNEEKFNCIAHQCNTELNSELCGGIAGTIFKTYNTASFFNNSIINTYKLIRYSLLGQCRTCKVDKNKIIFNLYSQYSVSNPTKGIDSMQCRLSYLKQGLEEVKDFMILNNYNNLGLPLIASGLAKQKEFYDVSDLSYFKEYIMPTIKEVFKTTNINITIVYL
jgi:hypothetical protein